MATLKLESSPVALLLYFMLRDGDVAPARLDELVDVVRSMPTGLAVAAPEHEEIALLAGRVSELLADEPRVRRLA
jgi:hypothetical protein